MTPDQRDRNGVWLSNAITKEDLEVADVADEICWICKTPGYDFLVLLIDRTLLLCDGPCKRAFHFRCLKLRVIVYSKINPRK